MKPLWTLGLMLILATPAPAVAQVMDHHNYSLIVLDLLEYQPGAPGRPLAWDAVAWSGGDFTRFWIKSEGSVQTAAGTWEADVQGLYSRLIAPFWEFQAGGRVETKTSGGTNHTRGFLVVGLEGLAPYWFEIEPAVFLSHRGDLSARLTATYDMYLAQRMVAQPRLELKAALQEVPEFGVGPGLNDLNFGFRVRYEIRREFAPYLGVQWVSKFAETASLARSAGEAVRHFTVVGGLRVWF